MELHPESSLAALGASAEEEYHFYQLRIFTVRQLAELKQLSDSHKRVVPLPRHRVAELIEKANLVINSSTSQVVRHDESQEPVWGYIFVKKSVIEKIDEGYKSPYVLFNEYMQCPPAERKNHLWKDIFIEHKNKAILNIKPTTNKLSDMDVLSYLIWDKASSIGKFDLTAGARAILFFWTQPSRVILACNKTIERYPVRFNLTKLCSEYNAKLYKQDALNEWVEASTKNSPKYEKDKWSKWQDHSIMDLGVHGSIVLPDGIVPRSCLMPLEAPSIFTTLCLYYSFLSYRFYFAHEFFFACLISMAMLCYLLYFWVVHIHIYYFWVLEWHPYMFLILYGTLLPVHFLVVRVIRSINTMVRQKCNKYLNLS